MNGPDHYKEAERLLTTLPADRLSSGEKTLIVQEAQVHALLAVAAATAMQPAHGDGAVRDRDAWYKAAGTQLQE